MNLPKHLVLSGGGINGIQTLKAIHIIEQNVNGPLNTALPLESIDTVSIGSFIGLAIVLGYRAKEYIDKCIPKDESYMNILDPIKLSNLLNFHGLTNNDIFTQIVDDCVTHKYPEYKNNSISFIELFNLTHIQLNIQVTNLTTLQEEIWNHITQPDMPVSFAIKVSSCLPIMFSPISYNGYTYVDGGLKHNLTYKSITDDSLIIWLQSQDEFIVQNNMNLFDYIKRLYTMGSIERYNMCNNSNTIFIQKSTNIFNMNIGFNDILHIYDETIISLELLSFFKVKEKKADKS